ncbi:glycoside hydrolase family 72 protein, partial [Tortispora caseinolytica NRRL Y-17796]
ANINPITIKGKHFFDSVTGEPFFIRGVDYQPGGEGGVNFGADVLSDPTSCARDAYLLQNLKVNTIRVYAVDPTVQHDECMSLFAAAGIYVMLDLNSPLKDRHLHRYEPWTTYTQSYLENTFSVIDAFSGYDNILAYFVGNEVVNDHISAEASPVYIKALIRDVKNYMDVSPEVNRPIPLGYSAADDLRFRISLPKYLACGPEKESVDFYGVNSYQWCGDQTVQSSGYNILIQDYSDFSIPVMFSEFGCNAVTPRLFQEIDALFSEQMTSVFSGGLVYEYTQGINNYGLVSIDPETGAAHTFPDYDTVKSRYAKNEHP